MAIQDSIPLTTLERAVSTDVITAQALINRTITHLARQMTMGRYYQSTSAQLRQFAHVASGLFLRVTAGQMFITEGVLFQAVSANPPSVPAADSFDSDYRFGLNFVETNQSDPWNGNDRYWLLQARVVRTTTLSEKRDIYNPAAVPPAFSPSGAALDKRYESQIETSWKEGTANTIPTEDAGYSPLAAVYRPAGGGVIVGADIINLSIQLSDLDQFDTTNEAQRHSFRFFTASVASGVGNPDDHVYFNLGGKVRGFKYFARADSPGKVIRDAAFIDPTDIGVIGTDGLWWYVYMSKVGNWMPSGLYGADVAHRGVIVASRVPPGDFGTNSAVVDVPNPIGGQIDAGEGVFLGVFRASGVLDNVHYIDISESGSGYVNKWEFENDSFLMNNGNNFQSGAHNLAVTGPGGTEDVPFGVHLRCFVESADLNVASVALSLEAVFSMTGDTTTATDHVRNLLSCRNHFQLQFELRPRNGDLTMTVTPTARTAALAASGGGLPDAAGNEFRGGIYGIRF